jgi:ArsR family transcriptional regulator
MITPAPALFGQLAALADATRARLLLLLDQQPLSVGELCAVMQLPQSTVSRHLKVLADEGWIAVRAEGASRVYRLNTLGRPARQLWDAVRAEITGMVASQQDVHRLRTVVAARRSRSAAFFAAAAGRWDAVRRDLFGADTEVTPLLALLERDLVVGDLGCGTGQVAVRLSPYVRRVVGVDASPEMVSAARQRMTGLANVEIRQGQLEDLPLDNGELDVALLILVLHYVVEPGRVLLETARVIGPAGRLLIVDMAPHDRAEFQETMGHIWPGFSREELGAWLAETGFSMERHLELPADPKAKGPNLMAVVARRTET